MIMSNAKSELNKLNEEKEDLEKLLSERNIFYGQLQKYISMNKMLKQTQGLICTELKEQTSIVSKLLEMVDQNQHLDRVHRTPHRAEHDQSNSVTQVEEDHIVKKIKDGILPLMQSLGEESNKINDELLNEEMQKIKRGLVNILVTDEVNTSSYKSFLDSFRTANDFENSLTQMEPDIQALQEEVRSAVNVFESTKLCEKIKAIDVQELKEYRSSIENLEMNLKQAEKDLSNALDRQVTLSNDMKEKDQLIEKLHNKIKSIMEAQDAEQAEFNATFKSLMTAHDRIGSSECRSQGDCQSIMTSLESLNQFKDMIEKKHAEELKAKDEEMMKLKILKEEQLLADQHYEHQMEEQILSLQAELQEKCTQIECLMKTSEEKKNVVDNPQFNSDLLKMIEEKENEINLFKQNYQVLSRNNENLQAAFEELNQQYQKSCRDRYDMFELKDNFKTSVNQIENLNEQLEVLQCEIKKKDIALKKQENSKTVPEADTTKMQEKYTELKKRLSEKNKECNNLKENLISKQNTIDCLLALKASCKSNATSLNEVELFSD